MEDEEKQDGNNFDNSKIECKSKRSINILLLKLKNYIGSYVSKPSQTENYDLEALNRKIYQTYSRVFMSSVLVEGQAINNLEEDDTTSEFEPLDTQKEDYIKTVLINRFDEQLVNTTRLRKTGPHTMKSHIKKIIRPELKYLAVVNVVVEQKVSPLPAEIDDEAQTMKEDIEARLHQTDNTVGSTQQKCDENLIKTKDLLCALNIYKETEKSEIYKCMRETPPQTPFTQPRDKTKDLGKCEINKRLLP